jgi:transposase-like protein
MSLGCNEAEQAKAATVEIAGQSAGGCDAAARSADAGLPASLKPELLDAYKERLYAEYDPRGTTEMVIVNELARRAAAMELLAEAIDAMQREGARGLIGVTAPLNPGAKLANDAVLAGAVASSKLDECERRSLGNARAFFRGLNVLQELQKTRRESATKRLPARDERFATEVDCERYLVRRFEKGEQTCRRCGQTRGHWIPARRCWECSHCGVQTGVRFGTVMARSPLPLTKWFAAIRLLLLQPTISTIELAERIDIQRTTTVRSMATRIRSAMAADEAPRQLAGLDSFYSRPV